MCVRRFLWPFLAQAVSQRRGFHAVVFLQCLHGERLCGDQIMRASGYAVSLEISHKIVYG